MSPGRYDIRSLERQLDDAEGNDEQVHKLLNNLGVAYTAVRDYNKALRAHTEEKIVCRRLSENDKRDGARLVDLAIAYRLCGDAMMRVKGLLLKNRSTKDRKEILQTAHAQHEKGLTIALSAGEDLPAARVEVQAACAAVAHSALVLGMETRDRADLERACSYNAKAASIANSLGHADRVSLRKKRVRLLGAAVNVGIALSALKEGKRARAMLEAAAVRAKQWGDDANFARAVANLAEEANINSDWEMSEKYIRLWVDWAKSIDDEGEESDALRKLGNALYKQHRKEEARDAFQRALLLATEHDAKKEARTNLRIAENELEEERQAAAELKKIEESLPSLPGENNLIEEARLRIKANELAYRLRKPDGVIEHCLRYIDLVDNHNCDPEVTGVPKQTHLFAVANLADAYWQQGNCSQAVHWATRELTGFGDDIAGQAQAWCNIGVYLTDDGKKEEGIDALRKSIELAQEAGDVEIATRAQDNIDITMAESEKSASLLVATAPEVNGASNREAEQLLGDAAPKLPLLAAALNSGSLGSGPVAENVEMAPPRSSRPPRPRVQTDKSVSVAAMDTVGEERKFARNAVTNENSIILFSGAANGEHGMPSGALQHRQPSETSSGAFSVSRPRRGRADLSRSTTFSRGGDPSSATTNRIIPVAEEYKKLCTTVRLPPTPARSSILALLRKASASALTLSSDAGKDCVAIDVRACFLSDSELENIFRALALFGARTPIALSLAQNPLLSSAAYRCFAAPVRLADDCAHIRRLNLSSAGLDASALQLVAQATQAGRGLSGVAELTLSKNGLGRNAAACAFSCAMMLTSAGALESVDLSQNLLPSAFLKRLGELIRQKTRAVEGGEGGEGRKLKQLDLKVNNRRGPKALLEFEDEAEAVGCVAQLIEAFPLMHTLDLRSCGAGERVRRALYSFAREADAVGKVVIVSPGTLDEAAL